MVDWGEESWSDSDTEDLVMIVENSYDANNMLTSADSEFTEHKKLVNIKPEEVFSYKDLMAKIVRDVTETSTVFGISTSNAAYLLRKFRWNLEALTEKYYIENLEEKLPSTDKASAPYRGTN
jgi:hypothetical protein